MTATTYKVLGIPMQRQSARRKLVVITYALLATLCGSTFVLHLLHGQDALLPYSLAIYGSLVVGIFVFGGAGSFGGHRGLLKPFSNKPPRPEPPMVTLVKLQLQPESLFQSDDAVAWKNDERELARRDRAHYTAYQAITVAGMVLLLLAFWSVKPLHALPAVIVQNLLLVVALVTMVLALTLPSAIILWTEPDIDLS